MPPAVECPEPAELTAFHHGGELSPETADRLVAHLTDCPRCEAYLELLDAKERTEVVAFRQIAALAPAAPGPAPRPGSIIGGRYHLTEPLGAGGMGSVWLAEQRDPVRRMVAVKLIKPGMDSTEVLARFEAERQVLALMDHPNIAKVFDGGVTEAGRPFFVMELVAGAPISRHCDDRRLTVRERLALFVPVCRAVQHAHEKGVIHRDLKPSNILVTQYDGRPAPKVIDFGVAKAIGQPLTDRTLLTGFGMVVGTLEYMSPEQAAFNGQEVDARSDVYALGVLLYELLTGARPLARPALGADLLDVLRELRESDPPRPSARLSGSVALPAAAAARNTEPGRLVRGVRGELDWIVMRALEKTRTRRYQTASELAADVERCLAGEPVEAAPPSAAYRARKFVSRRRGPLLAAGILLCVGLLAHSAWRNSLRATGADRPGAAPDAEEARPVDPPGEQAPSAEWERMVAGLPPEEQVKEVVAELVRRNPDYDGRVEFKIEDGVVTKLQIVPAYVKDISPVRALPGLKHLNCTGYYLPPNQRQLADLSALKGLPLTDLDCGFQPLSDLRPLAGMPLTTLAIAGTNATDLAPLRGMKLKTLNASRMPISDLTPLRDMPLESLFCNGTAVTDLSPLRGMPLKYVRCDGSPARHADTLRPIATLRGVNTMSASALWNKIDTADRAAAAYILSVKGTVGVDGRDADIGAARDLPPQPFRLTRIRAANCKAITTEGLAACEYCRHVTEINLQATPLTDDGLAFFQNCPDLRTLYLDQTKVTDAGLAWFAGRANVTRLRLDLTAVGDAGVAHFKNCVGLVELSLPVTKVTGAGLAHFRGCRRLRIIALDHTAVDDAGVEFLKDCPDLEMAGLADTQITAGGLAALKNHAQLDWLDVSGMTMTADAVAAVATCGRLTSLVLHRVDMRAAGLEALARCPRLAHVSLDDAVGLTDARLLGLAKCVNLREVRAKKTAVTPAGAAALKAALPECKVFLAD